MLKAESQGTVAVRRAMPKRPFVKDRPPPAAGMLLGYARVSKGDDQTNLLQAKALGAAG
jgi:hypothetical protein